MKRRMTAEDEATLRRALYLPCIAKDAALRLLVLRLAEEERKCQA